MVSRLWATGFRVLEQNPGTGNEIWLKGASKFSLRHLEIAFGWLCALQSFKSPVATFMRLQGGMPTEEAALRVLQKWPSCGNMQHKAAQI